MTNKKICDFVAVNADGDEVLGKVLYDSLSSVLIDQGALAQLCEDLGFPRQYGRRLAVADAFRLLAGAGAL